jgi:hypothetical protein
MAPSKASDQHYGLSDLSQEKKNVTQWGEWSMLGPVRFIPGEEQWHQVRRVINTTACPIYPRKRTMVLSEASDQYWAPSVFSPEKNNGTQWGEEVFMTFFVLRFPPVFRSFLSLIPNVLFNIEF